MRDSSRLIKIRNLGCCVDNCGQPAVAAHSNFGVHGKGLGIKADDNYTLPLCTEHHYQFDAYTMGMSREQSLQWFMSKLTYVNEVLDADDTPVF